MNRTLTILSIPLLLSANILLLILLTQNKTSRQYTKDQFQTLSQKVDRAPLASNEKVIASLTALQDELIRYRAEVDLTNPSSADSLTASLNEAIATLEDTSVENPYQPLVTLLRLKPSWSKVDVYEQPKTGSKIIGQAEKNTSYIITSQTSGWYQIRLNENLNGYIQTQFADEIN